MKITLNAWNGNRIYVNEVGAPRGQSLGYFQIEEYEVERAASYYAAHRRTKGDATITESRIEWFGGEGVAARVLDAVFGADAILYTSLDIENRKTEYNWRALREYSQDLLAKMMVQKCATGVEPISIRKQTKAEKQAKAAARAAQVFDLV